MINTTSSAKNALLRWTKQATKTPMKLNLNTNADATSTDFYSKNFDQMRRIANRSNLRIRTRTLVELIIEWTNTNSLAALRSISEVPWNQYKLLRHNTDSCTSAIVNSASTLYFAHRIIKISKKNSARQSTTNSPTTIQASSCKSKTRSCRRPQSKSNRREREV